jgi:hypothetical protein
MSTARRLGRTATTWRLFPILMIVFMYLLVPMFFFGLSELYMAEHVVTQALAIVITISAGLGLILTVYWCKFKGGDQKFIDFVSNLGKEAEAEMSFEAGVERDRPTQTLQDSLKEISSEDLASSEPYVEVQEQPPQSKGADTDEKLRESIHAPLGRLQGSLKEIVVEDLESGKLCLEI